MSFIDPMGVNTRVGGLFFNHTGGTPPPPGFVEIMLRSRFVPSADPTMIYEDVYRGVRDDAIALHGTLDPSSAQPEVVFSNGNFNATFNLTHGFALKTTQQLVAEYAYCWEFEIISSTVDVSTLLIQFASMRNESTYVNEDTPFQGAFGVNGGNGVSNDGTVYGNNVVFTIPFTLNVGDVVGFLCDGTPDTYLIFVNGELRSVIFDDQLPAGYTPAAYVGLLS